MCNSYPDYAQSTRFRMCDFCECAVSFADSIIAVGGIDSCSGASTDPPPRNNRREYESRRLNVIVAVCRNSPILHPGGKKKTTLQALEKALSPRRNSGWLPSAHGSESAGALPSGNVSVVLSQNLACKTSDLSTKCCHFNFDLPLLGNATQRRRSRW